MTIPAPGDRVVAVKTETDEAWFGFDVGTPEGGIAAGPVGPEGPMGPAGPAGPTMMMASQGQWGWHAAPTDGSDIGVASAGVDTQLPSQASKLWIYCDDTDGMDHTSIVESMRLGDSVFVYVVDDPDSWHQWTVTGAPIKTGEVWMIPVETYEGSAVGTEPPDGTPCVFQFRDTANVPLGGTSDQILTKASDAPGDVAWVDPGLVSFRYVQANAATTWTITHGLPYWPNVAVVDSTGRQIVPGTIDYPSTSVVVLTFSAAVAGEAYLS